MTVALDQVRCFIAVAEELHFGRAAERLAMTPPQLSCQIQKLERAVGAGLLDIAGGHPVQRSAEHLDDLIS
jgi:DNA-binding transcriptional LysR family regulator